MAEAIIEPFDCPVVGFVLVAETTTVTPVHGLDDPKATEITPVQPFEFPVAHSGLAKPREHPGSPGTIGLAVRAGWSTGLRYAFSFEIRRSNHSHDATPAFARPPVASKFRFRPTTRF